VPIDSGGDCFLLGWFSLCCKRGNFSLFLDLKKIQYCSVFGRGRRITVRQTAFKKKKKTVILPVIGVCGRKRWRESPRDLSSVSVPQLRWNLETRSSRSL
jgi:hypothetical protein